MKIAGRFLSRLLIELMVLAAFFFPLSGALQATNNPRQLDIRVRANGFGAASSQDITILLRSAGFELWRHCPRNQLGGIDAYYRPDHPQTNFKRTPSGRIAIGLAARDTHWAQYSFQFAHEFCHALANFSNNSQRLMRSPLQVTFWLEESLCERTSLFTLRAMTRSWRTKKGIFAIFLQYLSQFTCMWSCNRSLGSKSSSLRTKP